MGGKTSTSGSTEKGVQNIVKASPPMAKPPSGQVPGVKTPVSNPGGKAATGAPKSSSIPGAPSVKLPGMAKISTMPGGGAKLPGMKPPAPVGAAPAPAAALGSAKPVKPAMPAMKAEGKVYSTGVGRTTHAGAKNIKAGGAQCSHPPIEKKKGEIDAEKEVKSNPAKGADGKIFATGTGDTTHANAEYIKAAGGQANHPTLAAARGASADRQDKIGKGEMSGKKVTAGKSNVPKLPKEQDKGSGGQASHPSILPGTKV
jgi:hypothetical protein